MHPPQASLDLTRNFDEKVNSVLQSWFGKLTAEQISWMRLPLKKGGLGLSPTEPFRQTAYETSKSIYLEHFNLNSARECLLAAPKPVGENSITDSKANTALYHENIRTRLMLNPKTASAILFFFFFFFYSFFVFKERDTDFSSLWFRHNEAFKTEKFFLLKYILFFFAINRGEEYEF